MLDKDIAVEDVQRLANADALSGFFAGLGYETDCRVEQTANNLGITTEGTTRPIRRIDLLADQEGLLQVYLFELKSVTVAHTRSLARVFRNRAGNYLLVLTSDYEKLDFVLLEKYLPSTPGSEKGITYQQVAVRPRSLTVERKKPGAVHLRVLRRFTYTEADPIAQYEKLLSAYSVAEWSEEFFNNRALFSDYYLMERFREFRQWSEDPKPAFLAARDLYLGAGGKFSGADETRLRKELLEPTLKILGFSFKPGKESTSSSMSEPDYRLFGEDPKTPLALCLTYPWGRSLDGKDHVRDKDTPEENPSALVVSLLEKGQACWAVVTNGKLWRLFSAKAHSRSTNYYEIDLEEVIARGTGQGADPAECFRYFWLLFRREAFEPADIVHDGRAMRLALLDRLLVESEHYARELGERLKERVFEDVFPYLASGFISHIRERQGLPFKTEEAALGEAGLQKELDEVFQGTLTFLYRILFLLYAEARDLLPVRETRGFFEASLTRMKREIAEAAGPIGDHVDANLKKRYRPDLYELYDRLRNLFRTIDLGDPNLNVPTYNGGLFLSAPTADDEAPEAANARFINENKIPDFHLARALDLLARDLDPKRQDLVFIDYKSLGVRQLGSIYEGLLEFKVRIAAQELAVVKDGGREIYVPAKEVDESRKKRAEKAGLLVKKGAVYLENDKRERKATGSYYTPDYIVRYIVENTVGPVLKEKLEALRPKLRKAQEARRAFFKRQDELARQKIKREPDSKADLIGQELVEEFFDVKVLDPAMGSGHFLVETVDFITDAMIDFLNAFPWNPIAVHLSGIRETILKEMEDQGITIDASRLIDVNLLKRQILKRCLYGVDLNPMAVELAKVSLWLDCFTLGAPLSFLDHHLRCGNSLIGVTVDEVKEALEGKAGEKWQMSLFGSRFAGLLLATDLMRRIGELSDVTSLQVKQSRDEYRKASDELAPFKRILDIYASQWFLAGESGPSAKGKKANAGLRALRFLKSEEAEVFVNARGLKAQEDVVGSLSEESRHVARAILDAKEAQRFFHWELEFPEVFYNPRTGASGITEYMERTGFDAVIGNPPYVRQEGLGELKPFFQKEFSQVYSGVADIYVYFYSRGLSVCRKGGLFGMITSNKFLRAGYGKGLRRFLSGFAIRTIVDFKDLPIFPDATSYPLVLIAPRLPSDENHVVQTREMGDMGEAEEIAEVMKGVSAPLPVRFLREEGWSLQHPEVQRLVDKIRGAGKPLEQVINGRFYRGILTGYNEAFVIDESKKNELISADPTSADIIKPFLRGRDIKRWKVEWAGLYLIKTEIGVDIRRYQAIFEHLRVHQRPLEKRWDKGNHWWELRACDYYAEFEKPKIVWPDISPSCNFAFDNGCHFLVNTCYILPTSDIALLALLNSRLVEFFYVQVASKVRGEYLRFFTEFVGRVSIPEIPQGPQQGLTRNAEALVLPRSGRPDTASVEREIDEIVYRLYALTRDEIAIVERSVKSR